MSYVLHFTKKMQNIADYDFNVDITTYERQESLQHVVSFISTLE